MNRNLHPLFTAALILGCTATVTAQPKGDTYRAEQMKRWEAADLDKDGQLTKTEAQVGGLRKVVTHFDAIDTNKDGKVSLAELQAFGKAHRPKGVSDRKTASKDGNTPPAAYKTPEERRAAMDDRFKKMDTNGDGALTKAELQAAGNARLLEHFDLIDANKDGKITAEEIRTAWQKRSEGRSPR